MREFLTAVEEANLERSTGIEEFCNFLINTPITEFAFRLLISDATDSTIGDIRMDNLVKCLLEAGIEFTTGSVSVEPNGFNTQGGIDSNLPTAGGLFNLR